MENPATRKCKLTFVKNHQMIATNARVFCPKILLSAERSAKS